MDLGLRGRTAIVCGASSGIGLAIAESLAAEGANVAMFARRRDVLEREADRIGALAVRGDVTNPSTSQTLVDQTLEAFGGDRRPRPEQRRPAARPAPSTLTDEQVEDAVELLLLSADPARPALPAAPRGERPRARDRDHLERGQGADRDTSRSRTRSGRAWSAG